MQMLARRGLKAKELPEGWLDGVAPETAVIVTVEMEDAPVRRLVDFIGRGRGCYESAGETDTFLRNERDAWDH